MSCNGFAAVSPFAAIPEFVGFLPAWAIGLRVALGQNYASLLDDYTNTWLVPPFFDGRAQLKENLIFQLRAAAADRPFQYTEVMTNLWFSPSSFYSSPTNYAYAGYYYFDEYNTGSGDPHYIPLLDWFLPFEENYFDRNFVFDTSYLDYTGHTTTGVGGQFYYNYYSSLVDDLTFTGALPPSND